MSRAVRFVRRRRSLRALWNDASGLALVEFAFLATFLIFLYLGSVQLSDAIFANRKVTTTVRAITDLTTQYSMLTPGDLDAILNASAKVMAPYSADNAQIRISQIAIDKDGKATVSWSDSKGSTIKPLTVGEEVTKIPKSISIPNTFVILGEVQYEYHPIIEGFSFGALNFSDEIYMIPRVSSRINLLPQ